ncbi:MAG: response regulator transcription factor [Hyphomicrobiaceae bacterium]
MIVIVDERPVVTEGYSSWFEREGVSATGLQPQEFANWVRTASDPDILAVEAFLLGDCGERNTLTRTINGRTAAAVIAMNDARSLQDTLDLFAAGADDVVRKPVHVRELLARIKAIGRRSSEKTDCAVIGEMVVHFDGRDPEICGEPLPLPRRERRILEYLVVNKGRRVTKSQIFNSVYGLFGDDIDENVVESHISKLRKRLRQRLGHDRIDSQRYLGYRLVVAQQRQGSDSRNDVSSFGQVVSDLVVSMDQIEVEAV